MKLPGEGEVLIRGREPEIHTGGLVFFPGVKPPVYLEVRRNGRTWIAQGIPAPGPSASMSSNSPND